MTLDKTDTVETIELAGVELEWVRERGVDEGHYLMLRADDVEEPPLCRGPFARAAAHTMFEAMRDALHLAARQQSARLRKLVDRSGR
jgi:hypothetical protein